MNMAVYYGFVSGVSWLHILYLGFSPVFLHEDGRRIGTM